MEIITMYKCKYNYYKSGCIYNYYKLDCML